MSRAQTLLPENIEKINLKNQISQINDLLKIPEDSLEEKYLKDNFTSLEGRVDFKQGATNLVKQIQVLCQADQPGKNIFFKLAGGVGQAYKNLKRDVANNTVGGDVQASILGNTEFSRSQLSGWDSFTYNRDYILDSIKNDISGITDPETIAEINQLISSYKENWLKYSRKLDLETQKSGKDPREAAKNVKVDYHGSEISNKNVGLKYASRAFLGVAAGLGVVTGGAAPFIMSGARGLAAGMLGEEEKISQEAESILRTKLDTAGTQFLDVFGGDTDLKNEGSLKLRHLLQNIAFNPESKIEESTYQELDNFVTGIVADYSHKLNPEFDNALLDLGILLFEIKSKDKIIPDLSSPVDQRENDNQLNVLASKLYQIQEQISEIDQAKTKGNYREEARLTTAEGRYRRLALQVGISTAAVAGGVVLRNVLNGTLDDQLAGLIRRFKSPKGFQTPISGKDGFIVSKHALSKIQDLQNQGYKISPIDHQAQTGELVAFTKDGQNVSLEAASKSIEQGAKYLPHAPGSEQSFSYNGQKIPGIIQVPANHQVIDGLTFSDSSGDISVFKGDSGKIFELNGREYSILGEQNGNLLLVDTQNYSTQLENTLKALNTDSSLHLYASSAVEKASAAVSNKNFLGLLGGDANFHSTNQDKLAGKFTTWLKQVPGHDNAKDLVDIQPNGDFDQMGKNAAASLAKAIKDNPGALQLPDGTPVDSIDVIFTKGGGDFGHLQVVNTQGAANIADSLGNTVGKDMSVFPGWKANTENGLDSFIKQSLGGNAADTISPVSQSGISDINPSNILSGGVANSLGAGAIGGAIVGGSFGGVKEFREAEQGKKLAASVKGVLGGATMGSVTGITTGGISNFIGLGGLGAFTIAATAETVRRGPAPLLPKIGKVFAYDNKNVRTDGPKLKAVEHNLIGTRNTPRQIPVVPAQSSPENNLTFENLPENLMDYNNTILYLEQKVSKISESTSLTEIEEYLQNVNNLSTKLENFNSKSPLKKELLEKLQELKIKLESFIVKVENTPDVNPNRELELLDEQFRLHFSDSEVDKLAQSKDQAELDIKITELEVLLTKIEALRGQSGVVVNTLDSLKQNIQSSLEILNEKFITLNPPQEESISSEQQQEKINKIIIDMLTYEQDKVDENNISKSREQILSEALPSTKKYAKQIAELDEANLEQFKSVSKLIHNEVLDNLQKLGISPSTIALQQTSINLDLAQELIDLYNSGNVVNPLTSGFIKDNVLYFNIGAEIVNYALENKIINEYQRPGVTLHYQQIASLVIQEGTTARLKDIILDVVNQESTTTATPEPPEAPKSKTEINEESKEVKNETTNEAKAEYRELDVEMQDLKRDLENKDRTLNKDKIEEILKDSDQLPQMQSKINSLADLLENLKIKENELSGTQRNFIKFYDHYLKYLTVIFILEPDASSLKTKTDNMDNYDTVEQITIDLDKIVKIKEDILKIQISLKEDDRYEGIIQQCDNILILLASSEIHLNAELDILKN